MDIKVSITVANDNDEAITIRIPAGSIFEAAQTELGVQNVAVVQERQVEVPPHAQSKIEVIGRCLNRYRSLPNSTPGRATPFRFADPSMAQDAIWQRVASPTRGKGI